VSAGFFVTPFCGKAEVDQVERHFFKHVSVSIMAHFWNLLFVTDKNIVELQIIVDESAIVN